MTRTVFQPSAVLTAAFVFFISFSSSQARELPHGPGLAAQYTGDAGIDTNQAVVFFEDFEDASLENLPQRWDHISNENNDVLYYVRDVPDRSAGTMSLQMKASRGSNTGGHLFKVFRPGYDELYIRFYTKFAPDYGYCHHFVRIRGMINPLPYPVGNVSKQPSTCWCGTDIEPLGASFQLNQPEGSITPPGIWGLSSYWLEMNSWQGEGGTSFYPNLFEPASIKQVDRDRWVCVEVMVKMNSSPDSTDGEEAVWIDGRLVSHLGPGTLSGYWKRDKYYIDELQGEPFEGFRWRRSLTLKWNRLWLLHYVSETVFKSADEYAAQHPELTINTQQATVSFDHIVVAREYIGPMGPCETEGEIPGDFNGDGILTITDVIKLIILQRTTPGDPALDFNGDGKVDILDAIALILFMMSGS